MSCFLGRLTEAATNAQSLRRRRRRRRCCCGRGRQTEKRQRTRRTIRSSCGYCGCCGRCDRCSFRATLARGSRIPFLVLRWLVSTPAIGQRAPLWPCRCRPWLMLLVGERVEVVPLLLVVHLLRCWRWRWRRG